MRRIIRLVLENPSGASGSDPLNGRKGFYDYELDPMKWADGEMANRTPWYAPGTQRDQFRVDDPMVALGFHAPPDAANAAPPGAEGEEGEASRGEETDIDDPSELPV